MPKVCSPAMTARPAVLRPAARTSLLLAVRSFTSSTTGRSANGARPGGEGEDGWGTRTAPAPPPSSNPTRTPLPLPLLSLTITPRSKSYGPPEPAILKPVGLTVGSCTVHRFLAPFFRGLWFSQTFRDISRGSSILWEATTLLVWLASRGRGASSMGRGEVQRNRRGATTWMVGCTLGLYMVGLTAVDTGSPGGWTDL